MCFGNCAGAESPKVFSLVFVAAATPAATWNARFRHVHLSRAMIVTEKIRRPYGSAKRIGSANHHCGFRRIHPWITGSIKGIISWAMSGSSQLTAQECRIRQSATVLRVARTVSDSRRGT